MRRGTRDSDAGGCLWIGLAALLVIGVGVLFYLYSDTLRPASSPEETAKLAAFRRSSACWVPLLYCLFGVMVCIGLKRFVCWWLCEHTTHSNLADGLDKPTFWSLVLPVLFGLYIANDSAYQGFEYPPDPTSFYSSLAAEQDAFTLLKAYMRSWTPYALALFWLGGALFLFFAGHRLMDAIEDRSFKSRRFNRRSGFYEERKSALIGILIVGVAGFLASSLWTYRSMETLQASTTPKFIHQDDVPSDTPGVEAHSGGSKEKQP
jgi:hypothetical protein